MKCDNCKTPINEETAIKIKFDTCTKCYCNTCYISFGKIDFKKLKEKDDEDLLGVQERDKTKESSS